MIINVPGEIYTIENTNYLTREFLLEFYGNHSENDIIEVKSNHQRCHITHQVVVNGTEVNFKDLSILKSADTFYEAALTCPMNGYIPVIDDDGNYVSILKKVITYYTHYYNYNGKLDMTFLDKYNFIFLFGINEYAVELYKKAIPQWKGKKLFLCSGNWNDYIDVLPKIDSIDVKVIENLSEQDLNTLISNNEKALYIQEFLPKNEDNSRYEKGIMSYDEIMTLTFMFSYVIHPGKLNKDKKFFLIDGYFRIEGIFGIWDKVFTAARYAKAKGFIPVFQLITSDDNMYSDYVRDDIWNKFFLQPNEYSLDEVHKSQYLALSPNMNILNIMRYIMNEESKGVELTWPDGIFNNNVEEYIHMREKKLLKNADQTLGVLIRGTDYTKTNLPGHSRHATVEEMVMKIEEVEKTWRKFEYIYLATEDKNVCRKMKELYGERLVYTDQERYSVEEGRLLFELHHEKRRGKGFRLGVEYLCSLRLLSMCNSLIASGGCNGLGEALRENEGKYEHTYVFDLGINAR